MGEEERAQKALNAVRDELHDKCNNLTDQHTTFVENDFNNEVERLGERISRRKRNADKILEAGASAVPHGPFTALKNNGMEPCRDCIGTGNTKRDRTQPKPCTTEEEKCKSCTGTGDARPFKHFTNTSGKIGQEMQALEESPEEPEEAKDPEPEPDQGNSDNAGGSDVPTNSGDDNDSDPSQGESDNDPRNPPNRRLVTAELTPSEKVLRRRRLSNHPKSHIVVLERLMEEINRLN